MFNLDVNNFQKHEVEDSYAPFPAGTYQAVIASASIDEGLTGEKSKHPNMSRTLVKVRFDVAGAKQDGGSRPLFTNYMVAHQAADSNEDMANMIKRNQNDVFDLAKHVIMTRFGGNAQQSPFATGINPQSIPALAESIVTLEIGINKKNENYIKKLVEGQPQQQQQQVQQQSQQPMQPVMGGGVNQSGNGQQQNVQNASQAAQNTPTANAASHSNGFANGSVPPFAQQQVVNQ